MKKNCIFGFATLSAVLLLAGCGSKPESELTPAEYCEQNWGIAQEWICFFEDGSYCEDVAYSNGECKIGENVYYVVDETAIAEYCVDNGGELNVDEDSYLCMFADGSYCEAESYFNGECREWEIIYNAVEEEISEEELSNEEAIEESSVEEEVVAEEAEEVVEPENEEVAVVEETVE